MPLEIVGILSFTLTSEALCLRVLMSDGTICATHWPRALLAEGLAVEPVYSAPAGASVQ